MDTTMPLIRFLGPGLLLDRDGNPVTVRSRKLLALLAYLMTEQQVAHSRSQLLALFWPDATTADAQNNLRVSLNRLRKIPQEIAVDESEYGELLLVDRFTVQAQPAWAELTDFNQFNQLLESTRRHDHVSRGQCAECQARLQQAVQLYQGEFLAGLGLAECTDYEEWLFMQRERLRVLLLEAYQDLGDYAESTGDLTAARGFSQRQLELDSLREPAYRQQMRILAAQGDRSGALLLFERCRTVLSDELGLDPEPETLALHMQILNAEMPARADATDAPVSAPRHNLSQPLTPFIGREEEVEALQERLANPTYRLLSIVGPGGIGKSRLAQQVAAQQLNSFRDGVYFVALAQTPTAESIPLAIVETMQLAFGASDKSPAEQMFEMIGRKQILLVLDNFEHLMDGVDLLMQLLQKAPEVVLLITSRERLNLQAEDLFELHGLAVPASHTEPTAAHFAAIRLFTDRAHRLDKHFKLTSAQLPHVVQICQLVEGFPLAIELAATWIRDLDCADIVAELVDGLARLETTARDVDPQHRSLRSVFNASWKLLSLQERTVLARLAIFRGGFTLEAAHAVAQATPALLSGLRNKSLLRHAGARRYDMHALVHQFAAEVLANDAAEATLVRDAHSQYFLTLLAEQAVALDTRAAGAASALIQPEWENAVMAWQQAVAQREAPRLQNALDGLYRFCDLRGLYGEAQTLLESALVCFETPLTALTDASMAMDVRAQSLLCCRLLTALISTAECRGEFERSQKLAQKALALATVLDSKEDIIKISLGQAKAFELDDRYSQGLALAEKLLAMAEAEGLELQAGNSMELIGYNAYRLGDYARAHAMYQRLLAYHERSGRLELPARLAISILGSMAIDQGDYAAGLTYYHRFLASSQAADDRVNMAHAYDYLARAWNHLGDFDQAIALADQCVACAEILGDSWLKRRTLIRRSYAQRQLGQLAEALSGLTEAASLARINGSQLALADTLAQLAETQMAMAQSTRQWEEAAATFQEAATLLRAGHEMTKVRAVEIGLAELAHRRGDGATAFMQIEPILPHLPTESAAGWDEPLRAYLVCVRILHAMGNPLAQDLCDQARQLLDRLACNIADYAQRQTFLNAIPAHRELRAEWERTVAS